MTPEEQDRIVDEYVAELKRDPPQWLIDWQNYILYGDPEEKAPADFEGLAGRLGL